MRIFTSSLVKSVFIFFTFCFTISFTTFGGAGFFGVGGGLISYQLNGGGVVNSYNYGVSLGMVTSFTLNGGYTHTFKDANGNVCNGKLFYTIYKQGSRPGSPTFTQITLGFSSNSGFTTTATPANITGSGANDQRWANTTANVNVMSSVTGAGTWVLEVYWAFDGSNTNNSACNNNAVFFNNGGANYTFPFTVAATNYTWNATSGTADWQTPGSWTPARTTPAITDVLNFTNGGASYATNVPTQTISGINIASGTDILFQAGVADNILTINDGVSGADFLVNGAFYMNGANALSIVLSTGATGSVSGDIYVSNGAHKILPADANALVFNSFSRFQQGTGFFNDFTGNVFGTIGTSNAVRFDNGSFFKQYAGANPFGSSGGRVSFQTGSTYQYYGGSLSFSGRTYGNFEFTSNSTPNPIGGSPVSIDNLSVYMGILNIGMTGTGANISSIKGTIEVSDGAALNFNGTGASVQLNPATAANISRVFATTNGTVTVATGQIVNIASSKTINLQMPVTVNGELNVSGTLNCGSNVISGTGTFTTNGGATFSTQHVDGISSAPTNTGTIQTTTRNFNAGTNYVYNGTSNQTTGTGLPLTITTGSLTITTANNAVVTLTSPNRTTPALNLNSGLFSGGINIASGGVINANGGNVSLGTIAFLGSGTVSTTNATNSVYFDNVDISGGVNFGSATLTSTINNRLLILPGGFVNTTPPAYAINSMLEYRTGGTYGRGLEFSSYSGKGYPFNVEMRGSTALNVGNGGLNIARQIAGYLYVDIGSGFFMDFGTDDMTQPVTVLGGVSIYGSLSLSDASGGDLIIHGSWFNDGGGVFNPKGRAVFFNGNTTSSFFINSTAIFDYLFVNKTSGATVNLASSSFDLQVNNNLTLTSGTIVTGTNKVIIPAGSGVTQTTGWVNGNLRRFVPTGTVNNFLLPVGDASSSTPASINFTGSVTGTGYLDANASVPNAAPATASGLSQTKYLNRKWVITNSGVGGFTSYSPTFTFVAGDVQGAANTSNFVIRKLDGSTWSATTTGTAGATSTSATGVTSFSEFAIGETNGAPTVSTQPSDVTICAGSSTSFTVASTSSPAPTVQWQRSTDGGTNWTTISSANLDAPYTSYSTTNGGYTLNVTFVSPLISGYKYQAILTNINGSVTSSSATLTVNPLPTATVSGGGTVCSGAALPNVSIALTGAAPWSVTYSDGTNSTTVNDIAVSTYVITNAAAGTYTITNVSDANCTGTFSGSATVIVNAITTISIHPTGGTICPGGNILLNVTAAGTGTLHYQWKKDGNNVGLDQNSYTATETGIYTVVVTGDCGEATSTNAVVSLTTYTITSGAGAGGSISPVGAVIVDCGSTQNFTITPDAGFAISNVLVDGVSQGAINSYTFSSISEAHTISASFAGICVPPVPALISGPSTAACATVTTPVVHTYSMPAVAGVIYNWSVSSATQMNLSATTGNSVTITFNPNFSKGILTVAAASACGSYTTSSTIITARPAVPGVITQLPDATDICSAMTTGVTYRINRTVGATAYKWAVPLGSGAFISSASNPVPVTDTLVTTDTSVLITFPEAFVSGYIRVASINSCGQSSFRSITVIKRLPARPGTITQSKELLEAICNNEDVTFTIPASVHADGYIWEVPANTTITANTGTSITVSFPSDYYNGTIKVTAYRVCGGNTILSGVNSLTVTKRLPSVPAAITTASTNICNNILTGTPVLFTVTPSASGIAPTAYEWTVTGTGAQIIETGGVPLPAPLTTVTTSTSTLNITVAYTSSAYTAGLVSVKAVRFCQSLASSKSITIRKTAIVPSLSGAIAPCSGEDVTYTVTSGNANITSFTWTKPAAAVVISGSLSGSNATTLVLRFPSAGISGNVTVKSVSACGTSAAATIGVVSASCAPLTSYPRSSNAINLVTKTVSVTKAMVYPNPNMGAFMIRIETPDKKENARVVVTNFTGQVVRELTGINAGGIILINVNDGKLPSGVYHLKYYIGKETGSLKVVIDK